MHPIQVYLLDQAERLESIAHNSGPSLKAGARLNLLGIATRHRQVAALSPAQWATLLEAVGQGRPALVYPEVRL